MPAEPSAETTEGVSRTATGAGGTAAGGAGLATATTAGLPTGEGLRRPGVATPGALTIGNDWAATLTHKVEQGVSLVRDKTVRPVATAVRYLVFGLLAAFVGATMAVLFAIFAIRVLTTEVPVFHTRVWASYFVVAGIFWLAGLLLSRKRRSRS